MLLQVDKLNIKLKKNDLTLVEDISFDVEEGEIMAIVGESGSGKTLTAQSIIGLLGNDYKSDGNINFENENLLLKKKNELKHIRGKKIAMVYQEPAMALNPIFTIKKQLMEPFFIHSNLSKKEIHKKVIEILEDLKMPKPEDILKKYPFELSGGQKQRIVIGMALCMNPKIIIADEPTTALDVTTQKEILLLFREICKKRGTSIILITHDLGVVFECSDKVLVMYGGNVVEKCFTKDFFNNAIHPYSKGLIKARPKMENSDMLYSIKGNVVSLADKIDGCKFRNRCDYATKQCEENIDLSKISDSHYAKCIFANTQLD